MDVNEHGIWMTTWASPNITFTDHDGNVIWVNRNGDVVGDQVSIEDAAEIGITAARGNNIQIRPDVSANAAFFTISGNDRGAHISTVGRDGSGLFEVAFASSVGPFRPDATWHLTILDEGGAYDGFYYSSRVTNLGEREEGGFRVPTELLYIPYDLASGRLGAGVTAVEAVASSGTPDSYSLGDAYPNPFNPETGIEFSVAVDGHVRIDLYNAVGQQVASLVDEELSAGAYKTVWDALDQSGQPVSSGVYFYRMQAGDFTDTRSMTLLK
jgi:hypothetical protein